MTTSTGPKRAAQYVRMSTDHQQYSTLNQKTAIAAYAAARGIEIVATYEDSGKSGLTLVGRPELRRLIADVAAGQDAFDTILVYDVSRWGRFQDADQSAHLEYLCRLGGVGLEYCAEPFSNDGTPFASICKVVKRALAAEYSRELSEKVYNGQHRLVELGFRLGGSPGIGLRRCLIDMAGRRKTVLLAGEHKNIATDRVILIPGPPEEIAVVKRIYRDYVERDKGSAAIAEALNRDGVRSESGRPWTAAVVKQILTSEKYVGNSVWGRSSYKLQIARCRNPKETWARYDSAFEGIVSRALFDKAQKIRAARAAKITDEQVTARLRALYQKHGKITARLIENDRFLCAASIRKRHGSLFPAYELAGYRPKRDLGFIALNQAALSLRAATAQGLLQGFQERGLKVKRLRGACRFLVNGEIRMTVTVVQQRRSQHGNPRWLVKPAMTNDDIRVAVLMDGHDARPRTYYVFPAFELQKECLLAPFNPTDLEVLRSDSLTPVYELARRRDLTVRFLDASEPQAPQRGVLMALPGRSPRRSRLLTRRSKTYSAAFSRASKLLRAAVNRADAIAMRLIVLRRTLRRLLVDDAFVGRLHRIGIASVPHALDEPDRHILEGLERAYRDDLRASAIEFLTGEDISRRARRLLGKLKEKWQIEAAELIILAGDTSEAFARSLVAATPPRGISDVSRKHIYGADPARLKSMVAERDVLLHEVKRAVATLGRNGLDLVAVESFARLLTATPSVANWLQQNDKPAFDILTSIH